MIDEGGGSPFWDAIAGRFFGMSFPEADEFNAVNGTQFIADLMPRTPIYVAMLTESARAVIGLPHPSGRAAMRMLEQEGFAFERYVDIFDGGPTMTARPTTSAPSAKSTTETVAEIGEGGTGKVLARGRPAARTSAPAARSVKKLPKKGVMHRPAGRRAARGRGRRR